MSTTDTQPNYATFTTNQLCLEISIKNSSIPVITTIQNCDFKVEARALERHWMVSPNCTRFYGLRGTCIFTKKESWLDLQTPNEWKRR